MNPNVHQPSSMSDKERSCYNRMAILAAGSLGLAAIVSCGPDKNEPAPEKTPNATVITPETPTVTPKPTPTPLPPIPVAPLPPEHER